MGGWMAPLLAWWFLSAAVLGSAQEVTLGVPEGFVVAPFVANVWAENVTGARGIAVDAAGDVLVVVPDAGIWAFWEEDTGVVNRAMVVNNSLLNHGIAIYGNHIYASSPSTVWRWGYRAGQRMAVSRQETVVDNLEMNALGIEMVDGHKTRSLAVAPDGRTLYVSVGSTSNVDLDSFRARVRAFDLRRGIPSGGFDFVTDGVVFADGVRNEVGLGFDSQGRLWGVENGADELVRNDLGGDIHDGNPAEELNLFVGPAGRFYGYPYCWSEYNLARFGDGAGSQWVWPGRGNTTVTDQWCKNASNVEPPKLSMPAHSAPLGMVFYDGTNCGAEVGNATGADGNATKLYALDCEFTGDAFVAFHGSWNRDVPAGFKVSRVAFDNATGMPVSANDSAVFNMFGMADAASKCAGDARDVCLRPVDVKFDRRGALLVTSDATSQIIRITQTVPSGAAALSPSPSSAPSRWILSGLVRILPLLAFSVLA